MSTCPVCAGTRLRCVLSRHGYDVCECWDCTLRFLDPQPDDATLAAIYTAGYFLGERSPEAEARVARLKRAMAALYLDVLSRQLGQTTGHLLEIGCGSGDFLLEAQMRGFVVSGVEISADANATANHRLGVKRVIVGSLDTVSLPEAAFDVVAFADVIEHVRQHRPSRTRKRWVTS